MDSVLSTQLKLILTPKCGWKALKKEIVSLIYAYG
jgi:hypothetical protein